MANCKLGCEVLQNKNSKTLKLGANNPSVAYGASVSLRLGHATALTVHRTVIHYRVAASLPFTREPTLSRTSYYSFKILLVLFF